MAHERQLLGATAVKDAAMANTDVSRRPDNDVTLREEIWRRFDGDTWAAMTRFRRQSAAPFISTPTTRGP